MELSGLSIAELLERLEDWVLDAEELEAVNAELEAALLELTAGEALEDLASFVATDDDTRGRVLGADIDALSRLVSVASAVLDEELEIRNGNAAGDWPSLVTELAALFGREAEFEDELFEGEEE